MSVLRGEDRVKPIRLQLSRRKGFDLQALSHKFNGRDAVNVARPSKWGNRFTVTTKIKTGAKINSGEYIAVPTIEDAVDCYRLFLGLKPEVKAAAIKELRGKNLACWCKAGTSCHADVLLEIANAEAA